MREESSFFAERLRVAIAKAHLTNAELARILGVSKATMTYWTRGQKAPAAWHLNDICRATGCSLAWLMTEEPVDTQAVTR